jgi:PhzF family phenazine biosynthesis protein
MPSNNISVRRMAAFTDGNEGGNPAGIAIIETLPHEQIMQRIAADVGASETVFAAPLKKGWRVRYFSPETEIPFCGHATIALAAALGEGYGFGDYDLTLNNASIKVSAALNPPLVEASLESPPTTSSLAPAALVNEVLALFGYEASELDPRLAPALANAGANHLIVPLHSRSALAAMTYDLDSGRALMRAHGLVTIAFVHSETARLFHARNAFASGGVLEDPATGAAAAALAGYLRDSQWPHQGSIEILQGEDMGARSRLRAEFSDVRGSSVRVIGSARHLSGPESHAV